VADLDLDGIEARAAQHPPPPWHAGRTVGRTVYMGDGRGDLIGVMDSRALAEFVAAARADIPALVTEVRELREYKERVETRTADGYPMLVAEVRRLRAEKATVESALANALALAAEVEELRAQNHGLRQSCEHLDRGATLTEARVAKLERVADAAQARRANPKDPRPWHDLDVALDALEAHDG